MRNDERYERHQAGKKIVTTEYGVKYPDGTIDWNPTGSLDGDVRTPKGREEFRANRTSRLRALHQPDSGVTFVTRISTTRFTPPVPIGD